MMSRTAAAAMGAATTIGLLLGPSIIPAPASASDESAIASVKSLGMSQVADISTDGTIVLGMVANKYIVRNLATNKVLRTIARSKSMTNLALTGDGRQVLLAKQVKVAKHCDPWNQPWILNVATNKSKPIAATKSGASLKLQWKPTCNDDYEPAVSNVDQHAASEDGRYVAFCSTLRNKPSTSGRSGGDLYIKDTKSGALRTVPDTCSYIRDDSSPYVVPRAPEMSADGQTIMITDGWDNVEAWPMWDLDLTRVLRGTTTVRSGLNMFDTTLTRDGKTVYGTVMGSKWTDPYGQDPAPGTPTTPDVPSKYDVASGTVTPLGVGEPTAGITSDSGRFILNSANMLYDRQTAGAVIDLPSVLGGLGFVIDPEEWPVMSGDGRFLAAKMTTCTPQVKSCGWYLITLA